MPRACEHRSVHQAKDAQYGNLLDIELNPSEDYVAIVNARSELELTTLCAMLHTEKKIACVCAASAGYTSAAQYVLSDRCVAIRHAS